MEWQDGWGECECDGMEWIGEAKWKGTKILPFLRKNKMVDVFSLCNKLGNSVSNIFKRISKLADNFHFFGVLGGE